MLLEIGLGAPLGEEMPMSACVYRRPTPKTEIPPFGVPASSRAAMSLLFGALEFIQSPSHFERCCPRGRGHSEKLKSSQNIGRKRRGDTPIRAHQHHQRRSAGWQFVGILEILIQRPVTGRRIIMVRTT